MKGGVTKRMGVFLSVALMLQGCGNSPTEEWLVGGWVPAADSCESGAVELFEPTGLWRTEGVEGTWALDGSDLTITVTGVYDDDWILQPSSNVFENRILNFDQNGFTTAGRDDVPETKWKRCSFLKVADQADINVDEAPSGAAQKQPQPIAVSRWLDGEKRSCVTEGNTYKGTDDAVRTFEFNGDGLKDYAVWQGGVVCEGRPAAYYGNAGGQLSFVISSKDGYRLVPGFSIPFWDAIRTEKRSGKDVFIVEDRQRKATWRWNGVSMAVEVNASVSDQESPATETYRCDGGKYRIVLSDITEHINPRGGAQKGGRYQLKGENYLGIPVSGEFDNNGTAYMIGDLLFEPTTDGKGIAVFFEEMGDYSVCKKL